ncbi:hypothetical protein VTO42DRAFT_5273 [Malbranchea cinnamomea]
MDSDSADQLGGNSTPGSESDGSYTSSSSPSMSSSLVVEIDESDEKFIEPTSPSDGEASPVDNCGTDSSSYILGLDQIDESRFNSPPTAVQNRDIYSNLEQHLDGEGAGQDGWIPDLCHPWTPLSTNKDRMDQNGGGKVDEKDGRSS